jgi:atypical dual specificity phosphatase
MWTWSLNWGEVTPEIVIGSCPMTPDDLKTIAHSARVSAVLSLQHNDCLARWGIDDALMRSTGSGQKLVMARCSIRDFDVADMRRCLPRAVAELAALRAQGHRIYVHCTAGLGRSPLTVLAYLVLVEGYSPERAIRLIHAARPGAVPAWEAFHGCLEDLVSRHRAAIEKRAYELYEQGIHQAADADWNQAQADVLRSVLCP